MTDDERAVQVGDGFPIHPPPKPPPTPSINGVEIGLQDKTLKVSDEKLRAGIEAAMNNKAIDAILMGKLGPIPPMPKPEPGSELERLWAEARVMDD